MFAQNQQLGLALAASAAGFALARQAVEETLMDHSVNTSSVAMSVSSITGDLVPTIVWRVDVQFIGDWMAPSAFANFVVSLDANIRGLPGPAHANSIWTAADPLVVLGVVGLY